MTQKAKTSLIRQVMRRILTVAMTVLVIGGAAAAVVFGADTLSARADAVPVPDAAALTPVSATPLSYEAGFAVTRRFTGQVEAGSSVPMSFELGGRLARVSVSEGDVVLQGDEIARLDTALLVAERTRLTASQAAIADQLQFAETRLDRAVALQHDGFTSQETLDQARANRDVLRHQIAELDAGLRTVAINIEKSVLYAPFDGRIAARNADETTTLAAGQTVVTVVATTAPEVRVGLPLDIETTALDRARIEISGATYPARLLQVRPDLDPLTRTRTVLFALDTDDPVVIGQTAKLLLQVDVPSVGVWVPTDALQEGAGSVWTVLVVQDDVVRSAAVELLHAEPTRAYVRGSFQEGAQLIDAGAHRVVPGQQVSLLQAGR